jgi:hypothetical protein
VIIGSGSASFEMLRYLTERLPVMATRNGWEPEPAPQVISALLYHVRPALEARDDLPTVNDGIGGTVDLTVFPARPRRA